MRINLNKSEKKNILILIEEKCNNKSLNIIVEKIYMLRSWTNKKKIKFKDHSIEKQS